MNTRDLLDRFVTTLARLEGFYDQKKIPSVSQRLNNPINIASFKDPTGTPYPEVMGVVEFPDVNSGWRAAQITAKIGIIKRGLTFYEFFGGKQGVYHGFCRNSASTALARNPTEYAQALANAIGGPDTDIHKVISSFIDNYGTTSQQRTAA